MRTILLTLVFLLMAVGPANAEEATVEAFTSFKARGQIFPTGPNEATFVGSLSGIIYVKDHGSSMNISSIDAGMITCPGTITIDTYSKFQVGKGKCVIVTPDSERVYAEFSCLGKHLNGCDGEFKITGGTGEKKSITGSGPIQLKSALSDFAKAPGSVIEQASIGLAVWPELTYKIENKKN
jgi:hypothetical protein